TALLCSANSPWTGCTAHSYTDKVKRQLWKVALRRRDFSPSERSVVCSCHFQAEDFDRTGQTTRIREGAIPSVFGFTRPRGKVSDTDGWFLYKESQVSEKSNIFQDHRYALDPANVKKRLNEAQEELEKLRRNLRNAKDRERRHKKTVKSVLEDLKHKHVLSEELQQRLACCQRKKNTHHGDLSENGR
uniref:THAP-type domain-containing protein n=1 Tax=Amphilophus citrinellus TaxID=61819 RepID=A0A3Q0T2C1_AMPCI